MQTVHFNEMADSTPIDHGEYVGDLGFGFQLSVVPGPGGETVTQPRIYDSDIDGGADPDLEVDCGNLLIIQEAQEAIDVTELVRRGRALIAEGKSKDAIKFFEKASKLDPSAFFAMIEIVLKRHPHLKVVATTLREVHSTSRHSWSAVAWIDGKTHQAPTAELDVLDRVGGGDGFASGFFYGLMTGQAPEEAVKLGWAHGALLTTFPGDTTMATVPQVKAFASGGSARIQR